MDVGHPRVEQAAEALDEAVQLDLALVGPDDGPLNGRVQRRRVAPGRQDSDPAHAAPHSAAQCSVGRSLAIASGRLPVKVAGRREVRTLDRPCAEGQTYTL